VGGRRDSVSYTPQVALRPQRGCALTSELVDGNKEKLSGGQCAKITGRARPAGHRPRAGDARRLAYYVIELL
jgi:hypothetical protein